MLNISCSKLEQDILLFLDMMAKFPVTQSEYIHNSRPTCRVHTLCLSVSNFCADPTKSTKNANIHMPYHSR